MRSGQLILRSSCICHTAQSINIDTGGGLWPPLGLAENVVQSNLSFISYCIERFFSFLIVLTC
jgi:hypothetical protein